MSIYTLFDKWKKFAGQLNQLGIPLPTVRDPKTGAGSVSLTLLVLSSVLLMAGIVSKWSGFLGGVEIQNALSFFYASSTLYFGRNLKNGPAVPVSNDPKSDDSGT